MPEHDEPPQRPPQGPPPGGWPAQPGGQGMPPQQQPGWGQQPQQQPGWGQQPQQQPGWGQQQPAWAQPGWQPPQRRPKGEAKWLPTLGLMGVVLFVTLGGFLFGGGTTSAVAGEVELLSPIAVGNVTIQPAEGWTVSEEASCPGGAILTGNGGYLLVGLPSGTGTPEDLVDFYVNQCLLADAAQLSTGGLEPVSMAAGEALRVPYVGVFGDNGTPIEGEVIAVVAPSGTPVVLDGWAAEGTYRGVQTEVHAMANSLQVP